MENAVETTIWGHIGFRVYIPLNDLTEPRVEL